VGKEEKAAMNSLFRIFLILGMIAAGCMIIPAGAQPGLPSPDNQDTGRFIVHCDVDGAVVMLDNEVMGVIANGSLVIPVNTTGPRYRTFTVTFPGSSRSMIWVMEGSDLMFSSYGVSPEMATSEMVFSGTLPNGFVNSAQLFLVAPSGGYSRDIEFEINKLMVNRLEEEKTPPLIRTIFSLLFPNYKGKEWSDIFSLDNTTQIGFETKEIKPYLKTENNRVAVRDQGDYMQLTNAILSITYSGEPT
jgi:hypothetical protein